MSRQVFFGKAIAIAVLFATVGIARVVDGGATFTIVAVPDIQNETQYYPNALNSEINWIVDNRAARNIVAVAQQGDLTNNANTTEFTTAHNGMFRLNNAAGLPWGTCPGNHDLANPAGYDNFFGPTQFAGKDWYGGAYGHSSYQTFSAGGRNFLLLDLEYHAANDVLNWAQGVINANPNKPTIINTHDYMVGTNTGVNAGRSTYGQTMFKTAITGTNPNPDGLVYGNHQVFMVICGHNHYEYSQTTTNKAGEPVMQLIADYQDGPYGGNGGNGYMRLYEFDEANSAIHVKTFSPCDTSGGTAGTYQTGAQSQFDIPLDFNSRLGAVPEPSTSVLTCIGLLVLCGVWWGKRRIARVACR
jgi:hypothetical protein